MSSSLIDQFQHSQTFGNQIRNNNELNYGGDLLPGNKEDKIFTPQPFDYEPPSPITFLVVNNNIVSLSLQNGTIVRLNLDRPEDLENAELKQPVHKLFQDPSGIHLIVAMKNEDIFYLNLQTKNKVIKLKGKATIESVAWDTKEQQVTPNTAVFLYGTNRGQIGEGYIGELGFTSTRDSKFKILFDLKSNEPVTGLVIDMAMPNKYLVMASTPTKVFQFEGGSTFEALFQQQNGDQGKIEIPGDLKYSELHLFNGMISKSLAYLCGSGIFHRVINSGSEEQRSTGSLIPYPGKVPALSVAVTEFHYLLLFETGIKALSRITMEVIWDYSFKQKMVGITRDSKRAKVYAYSSETVYEINIKDEAQNVWEKYLLMNDFDMALKFAKTNPAHEDVVLIKRAEHSLAEGEFNRAAADYALTSKSFEEVCLKFIDKRQDDALRIYLLKKLEKIGRKSRGSQLTMICTWLVQIFIDKFNYLNYLETPDPDQLQRIKNEFQNFIEKYKDYLDPKTTFQLMESNGYVEEIPKYANEIKDYEKLITYYLQNQEWKNALDVLEQQKSPELFYRYCPILMEHYAVETVNILTKTKLEPRRLIPALVRYETKRKSQNPKSESLAIAYLNHVVTNQRNTDPPIHNYLLSLYTEQEKQEPLMKFLEQKDTSFDLEFALRLCTKRGKNKACVLIYSKMKLYLQAVDMALNDKDIDLAKRIANMPRDDYSIADSDELRKKLWLRIARHVVEKEKLITNATNFLRDCSDLLKIEDILPFFPDFVLIDEFKEEICKALQTYNKDLELLKKDMADATISAERIREDIKHLRNNYVVMEVNQKCELCKYPILTTSFYAFPCAHTFHCTCLQDEMQKHLKEEDAQTLAKLKSMLVEQPNSNAPSNLAPLNQHEQPNEIKSLFTNFLFFTDHSHENHVSNNQKASQMDESMAGALQIDKVQRIQEQIDSIVAHECLSCGQVALESIDRPFIDPFKTEENISWRID